eukprot:SAG11_NODE_1577_length_4652_cov_12.631013_8_plen_46_part_00
MQTPAEIVRCQVQLLRPVIVDIGKATYATMQPSMFLSFFNIYSQG